MAELALESFKGVEIEDRDTLARLLAAGDLDSCDYNVVNLYCWGEVYDIRWKIHRGMLVMHSGRDDLLFMPVGNGVRADELICISDEFRRQGKSGDYALVDARFVESNPALSDKFAVKLDAANANYVYRARKLFELRGKKLQKKKNLLSQFMRNNPDYVCKRLTREYLGDCFALAKKWCMDKTCEDAGFTHERFAMSRAFGGFEELGLDGLVILSSGRIVGFSVFSPHNDGTALVHFEKYDREVKGAAQAINWETARRLMGKYEFINREQDLGLEGLRRAKRSYCPEFMVTTYTLHRCD